MTAMVWRQLSMAESNDKNGMLKNWISVAGVLVPAVVLILGGFLARDWDLVRSGASRTDLVSQRDEIMRNVVTHREDDNKRFEDLKVRIDRDMIMFASRLDGLDRVVALRADRFSAIESRQAVLEARFGEFQQEIRNRLAGIEATVQQTLLELRRHGTSPTQMPGSPLPGR